MKKEGFRNEIDRAVNKELYYNKYTQNKPSLKTLYCNNSFICATL